MDQHIELCAWCKARKSGGHVWFREQHRQGHRAWSTSREGEAWSLCQRCFLHVAAILQAAAAGHAAVGVLGVPAGGSDVHASDHGCEFCQAPLGAIAYAIEVLPLETHSWERGKPGARLWQHRLCRACASWARTMLYDHAAVTGSGERAGEGPLGHWLPGPRRDVVTAALTPRDAFVVQQTVVADGGRSAVLQLDAAARIAPAGHTTFVAASRMGRAARMVAAFSREVRRKIVVVARLESVPDAVEAMRLGAGDLLASPLSPQQVTGALNRITRPEGPRDPATGLPVLAKGSVPFLRFVSTSSDDLAETALLVRRFVRGYDDVGLNEMREVVARLRCPIEQLPAAATRLRLVLEGVTVLLGDEAAEHAAAA